jgi:FkbH-like protein
VLLAANGRGKKVLVFDCDGTLWKGIVGEDGLDGIQIGPGSAPGLVFHEVQSLALGLHKQGVLLGLCSKNNVADVEEVLQHHPGMLLRSQHFAVRRVNWSDKATNLRAIAAELNLGIESLVFVEDSEFEANLVREQLPEVTVLQVPRNIHEYPAMLRRNLGLFYNLSRTEEDRKRARSYAEQAQREEYRQSFAGIDDYLRSLGLAITLYVDAPALVPRVAQLTQKTNQFNLTTRRYTSPEIEQFVACERHIVTAFSVSDRFGDSGVTGAAIIEVDRGAATAQIDTMLLSCRVIGRNVELAFFDVLISQLMSRGIRAVQATYRPTPKNAQVADFYDRLGFTLTRADDTERAYTLDVSRYHRRNIDYIKVNYGQSDKKCTIGGARVGAGAGE